MFRSASLKPVSKFKSHSTKNRQIKQTQNHFKTVKFLFSILGHALFMAANNHYCPRWRLLTALKEKSKIFQK